MSGIHLQTDTDSLTLLLDSLAQPEISRSQWIQAQHQYSHAVQQQVLKILQQRPDLGPFEQPLVNAVDDHSRIGQVIGGYRLEQLIGQGGMGVVYLARRTRDFEHQCAVKLIRSGRMTAASRTHFIRERQTLAAMQHPYIAHLLDGGTSLEGDEFLLMEWIDGLAIDDYCRTQRLDHTQILRLFGQLCQAIGYAHGRLLVHGDIKPNNILITADGTPKLLDFGIAQHLQQPPDGQPRALSRHFASPEQLEHQPLSVRSDIYSLCSLLQVLLCGELKPNPAYLQLPAELRAIIAQGRATHAPDRYSHVSQLLDDCERYRKHQPVQAYSARWSYLSGKFIRRHRLAVGAGLLLFGSIISGAAVAVWQAGIARTQQQYSEQFARTLVELLTAPDPYADGSASTVKDMLDSAGRQLLSSDNQLPGSVRGDLLLTLGQVYIRIDEIEKAREIEQILQHQWPSAQDISYPLYAKTQHFSGVLASRTGQYDNARNYLKLAHEWYQRQNNYSRDMAANIYELGRLYMLSGQQQLARVLWADAIVRLQQLDQSWVAVTLAQIYNDLGIADEFVGDFASARHHYQLSIEYFPSKKSLAAATQLGNLASVERKSGNLKRAIEWLNQSLQMHYAVVGTEHKEVSMILSDLALAYADNGQPQAALEHARQALNNALAHSGPVHRNTAAAYFALGNAELLDKQLLRATEHLQQALAIRQRLLGEQHQRTLDVTTSLAEVSCLDSATRDDGLTQLDEIIARLAQQADSNRYYLQRARGIRSGC